MDISIIIPLYNEAESLPPLYEWISRVMKENKFSYEIIFVNDGSADNSWQVIKSLTGEAGQTAQRSNSAAVKQQSGLIRGICFRRNYGKSAALYCGFKAAQGDVVITMDADLQDSPDEIPDLYRMITEDGFEEPAVETLQRYGSKSNRHPVA